jgi:hypothetical protein
MIVRSKRSKHFTVIDNGVLEDDRISFRAKGVLVFLLSKPDNWKVSERHLARTGQEGVTAIRAALKELEQAGYIERRRLQGAGGLFEWESVVFDTPRFDTPASAPKAPEPCSENRSADSEPCSENLSTDTPPCLDFPCVDKPCVDNRARINTDLTSTELISTPTPAAAAAPTLFADIPPVELIPAATAKKALRLKANSPHMPAGLHLPGGHIPEGAGKNPVQVYYERFNFGDPAARLNRPQEDDLARLCPDLARLRDVIIAYSRTGYRPGNIQLIFDWYRNGVPSKDRPSSSKSAGYARQERGGTSPRKETQDAIDSDMAEFLATFTDARDGSRAIAAD